MFLSIFPDSWTYYPLDICNIGTNLSSDCCSLEPRQREQVVREDCAAHILHSN